VLEYSIPLSETADVVEQLRTKGRLSAFAVLMFDPPEARPGPHDPINLQYSLESDILGLDWILLGPRNVADKDQLICFIRSQGYAVEEREVNDVCFLRVEHGNLIDLGLSIAIDFYEQDLNAIVGLLVDGFDYEPRQDFSKGIAIVRMAGAKPTCAPEVTRIASLLRLIAGKTTSNEGDGTVAHAVFESNGECIRIVDEILADGAHRFRSQVSSTAAVRKIEWIVSEEHGIDLMRACGYGCSYYEDGDYVRLFLTPTDAAGFRDIAEFILGLLGLLFAHHLGEPVDVQFFVPVTSVAKLPNWKDLPISVQADYGNFMYHHYRTIALYHNLMARDDDEPLDPKTGTPAQVCYDMQAILDVYPAFLSTLRDLDDSLAHFLKVAEDDQIEMTESLNLLRRRYRAQLFN
jgi:hypothetical protein